MLSPLKRVYTLQTFTVELRDKGWFFWLTYGNKSEAKGPYKSISSLSLMMARDLKRELTKRDSVHVG
jgi:hypothetical protein